MPKSKKLYKVTGADLVDVKKLEKLRIRVLDRAIMKALITKNPQP